jgi:hypothetical protein
MPVKVQKINVDKIDNRAKWVDDKFDTIHRCIAQLEQIGLTVKIKTTIHRKKYSEFLQLHEEDNLQTPFSKK